MHNGETFYTVTDGSGKMTFIASSGSHIAQGLFDQAAASEETFLDAITGVVQLLTYKLWGEMGCSLGRRAFLRSPRVYLLVSYLGIAFSTSAPLNVVFGLVLFVLLLFGSPWVAFHLAFATVPEVTRRCSPTTRLLCFSIEEAFLWAGLPVSPFVGSFLIDLLSSQNVFFVAAGGMLLNPAVTHFNLVETLELKRW